ncbi:MAG: sodium:proton antiporter [Prevotella sp.]|nr:sodium:proton antiporter [Prevotella sp.]MBQ9650939.1 sodium:proton antiporter [Prevotella sp.]
MTLVIVAILLLGFALIATAPLTRMNKAAIAVFAGTVGWVLYICWGADFVMKMHSSEYIDWLSGANATSLAVKQYIAQNIFLKYVGRGAEIVLFLLATMTIVEILDNNGCFDFLKEVMRTRKSKHLLWIMTSLAFVVSANLDNITTATMMAVIMHSIVPGRKARQIYGAALAIAVTCGGALTVVGDPVGLVLWTNGYVTATNFSMSLLLPCVISWLLPTLWLSRLLPETIDSQWSTMPYRGDDTNLNKWQRLLMLVVGIGGLWFIPTFHNITQLSPFIGALCVLSVLWIVNEVMNRKLFDVDKMIQRRTPRALQYALIQRILFVMGIMLAIGVTAETGAIAWLARICDTYINNVWIMGALAGFFGTFLDTFATAISFFSLYPDASQNDIYWKLVAYSAAMGSNVFLFSGVSGIVIMKMERISVGWFFRNVGWVSILSWVLGMAFVLG